MNTRSVSFALSWEYWRRGMVWFVPSCLAVVLGILLLLCYSHGAGGLDVSRYLGDAALPLAYSLPVVLALASWTALRRHYVLPVTTPRIVRWSLVNGAVAAAGMYVVIGLVLNVFLGAHWPLLVPPLLCVAVYVMLQAVLWWIGPSGGVLCLLIAILSGLWFAASKLIAILSGLWFAASKLATAVPASAPSVSVEIPTTWAKVTAGHGAVWLSVIVASYLLAINGVTRDRRGGAWSLAKFRRWWDAIGETCRRPVPSDGTPRFRSPRSAQFWLEWRAKGHYIPWTLAGVVGSLWLCFAVMDFQSHQVRDALGGITSLLFVVAPFLGVYLGSSSGGFDLKSFAATRPVADRDLAAAVLRNVAAVLACSVLVWVTGVLVSAAIWLPDDWQQLRQEWHRGFLAIQYRDVFPCLLVVTACWTLLALGASLALTRRWFVCCCGGGIPAAMFLLAWGLGLCPPTLGKALGAIVLATIPCGTLVAFVLACERGLVSIQAALACLIGYAFLVAGLRASLPPHPPSDYEVFVAVCLISLPVAPFALAPLAVAWNRHR